MNRSLTVLIFVILLAGISSLAFGLNYMYYSDAEITRFGDRVKWFHGDTLTGPIRSNDQFAIMTDPLFGDFVITSAADFWQGPGYDPNFHNAHVILNAPRLEIPDHVDWVRQSATANGFFYNTGFDIQTRALLLDHLIRFWTAPVGQAFDTNVSVDWVLPDSAVVFVNGPLWISGTLHSILILGAAGNVGIEDNLIYASSDPVTGRTVPGHPEKLALIGEGDVKIMNTIANGRENSSGQGVSQTDPALTSILLNGVFFALGESFTFDQQNDADSGYVCQCAPDDRGFIYLSGMVNQARRGYVHRANRASTGYQKIYHYDTDLKFWNVGVFEGRENLIEPASLTFPAVPPGTAVRDSIHVSNDFVPIKLDSLRLRDPFYVATTPDSFMWTQTINVLFAPLVSGVFHDTLRFYNGYYHRWFSVPVMGTAGAAGADDPSVLHPFSFTLSASPNPFNPATTLHFDVARAGQVSLKVYDVLGREVADLKNETMPAGSYTVMWDASRQPSGVYFARLESASGVKVAKLLLMK
jgi:hypothetical protein